MSMLAKARFFLVKSFLLLISWRAQIRVQEQAATKGDSRVPDCPLNYVSSYMYNLLHVSVIINSTSRALILAVPDCLSLLILIQST